MDASRQLFLCVALIGVAFSAVSCKKSEEPAAPAQTLQDAESGGGGVEELGLTIGYKLAPDYTYYVHREGDFAKPCTVTPADVASSDPSRKDVSCIIDGKELDLYYWGLTFKYNVPPSMCSYVVWDPYYYYAYEPMQGPDYISFRVNVAGVVLNLDARKGGATGAVATTSISMSGEVPTCVNGDYAPYGPNCCSGAYSMWISRWDSQTGTYAAAVKTDGQWPGRPANCLRGPAMDINPGLTVDGYPLYNIQFIEGEGLVGEYEVKSPMANREPSNVHIANYFQKAEHDDDVPLATRKPARSPGKKTQPYYELLCLNRAYELNARIRVMVRDWNEAKEWAKQGSGNPDTTGKETEFDEGIPDQNGVELNDYFDWKDFGALYPKGNGY